MRVSPTVSAPKMRARCEIDLSPGTRARPLRAPARRAVSGDLAAWSTCEARLGAGPLSSMGPKGRHRGAEWGRAGGAAGSRLAAIDTRIATRQVKHLISDPAQGTRNRG